MFISNLEILANNRVICATARRSSIGRTGLSAPRCISIISGALPQFLAAREP
ncbi:MAG TPA: hypothetical protein VF598_07450 [Hymenobacter sp.]